MCAYTACLLNLVRILCVFVRCKLEFSLVSPSMYFYYVFVLLVDIDFDNIPYISLRRDYLEFSFEISRQNGNFSSGKKKK